MFPRNYQRILKKETRRSRKGLIEKKKERACTPLVVSQFVPGRLEHGTRRAGPFHIG